MKLPSWLRILMWSSFGFTMMALGVGIWLANQMIQGRCDQDCQWYMNTSIELALNSMWIIIPVMILLAIYPIVFQRAEWLKHWRSRRKLPIWVWVLYVAVFGGLFIFSRYSQSHEEFHGLSHITFGLLYVFIWLIIFLSQPVDQRKRWHYLMIIIFPILGLWQIYDGWDSIGTQDLRYCLGQTYFQRVPMKSTGCEIVKAIPTPRYFAGRECPTDDLFIGCKSTRPWSFTSYNQRKARGLVTDRVPLPWVDGPKWKQSQYQPHGYEPPVVNCAREGDHMVCSPTKEKQ